MTGGWIEIRKIRCNRKADKSPLSLREWIEIATYLLPSGIAQPSPSTRREWIIFKQE